MSDLTKESYLKERKAGKLHVNLLYEYWKDHRLSSYKNPSLDEFIILIQKWITLGGTFHISSIFTYFDKKYHVLCIEHDNGVNYY